MRFIFNRIAKLTLLIILIVFIFYPNISFSQSCTITSKANDILPNGLCAPVILSWEVTYRGVNNAGTSVEIQFDWDDGNPLEIVTATSTNVSLAEWKATVAHTYPPSGNQCNYNPNATLIVNGVACASSIQEQNVTVWDTDDENGGNISINPAVFPICVGNDGTVIFNDVTLFNCVPPNENDNPNTPTRWTQWLYGTSLSPSMTNVQVGGSVQTYPFAGTVQPHTGPVTGPTPPNLSTLPIYCPNGHVVGEFFEVTLNYWNYCNPYPDSLPVTTTAIILIVPLPDGTVNPAGPFCANDSPIFLSAATSGGTWSGNGITNSNTGRFDPAVAGPGTHTITYSVSDGNGCVGVGTTDIIVYAIPTPNVLPGTNLEVCPSNNLFLDGNPTAGDGNITSHLWTGNTTPLSGTNIQAPTFNTNTQGTYNLTYTVTDDNGCSDFQNITVGVNPVLANIIPNPAEVCAGQNIIIDGNPSGGTGNYVTHIWTGNTANINNISIQAPTFNTSVLGTYNLSYQVIDDNGCTGNDNVTITVFENPIANAGVDDTICGSSSSFNASASIGVGTWTTISGPGIATFSNANSPTSAISVNTYGQYYFAWSEVNGPGCLSSDTVSITFIEQPIAYAGIDDSLCGLIHNLNATPSVGNGLWTQILGLGTTNFSNQNSSSSNITVSDFGSYTYLWTEVNNSFCSDTDTVIINFDLVPTTAFFPIDTAGCPPFTVNFTDSSIGGSTYLWNFGDGNTSNLQHPTNIFDNSTPFDTIYNVNLTVTSIYGCSSSVVHQVTVYPTPNSNFISDAVPGCSPLTANFTNNSNGASTYIWNFDDNTANDTTTDATHTFINDTTFIKYFDVQLIAISNNGCADTSQIFVTVYPNPSSFIAVPDSACSPSLVTFTATPGGTQYYWDYGDGTSQNGSYIASNIYINNSQNDTIYTVTLITTSTFGCIDTSYRDVTVFPSPTADFSADITVGCTPLEVNITNNSTGANTYVWNYGDGTTSTDTSLNLIHTYINTVSNLETVILKLYAENSYGCRDSITSSIIVYPQVLASFTADTAGCSPFYTEFNNQTFGANSYSWNFNDGSTSSINNPDHSFVNTTTNDISYNVELIAISSYGCNDTANLNITSYAVPSATFIAAPTTQFFPDVTVSFNNLTVGNWNYIWDFGDGTSSFIELPPGHSYITWGDYTIFLTAYSDFCEDTVSHIIRILAPEAIAEFTSNGEGCSPLIIDFDNTSQYSEEYYWDFGDGNISTTKNPSHTYYDEGTYMVELTSTGPGGSDNQTNIITVYPVPEAYFKVAPTVVAIPGQPIQCKNLSENSATYFWNFGDGSTSIEENPEHYYTAVGEYDISLVIETDSGCLDSLKIPRAVIAESSGEVDLPSAFTPDPSGPSGGAYRKGDYSNDIFYPVHEGIIEYNLSIFNRWGELIFESTDVNIGWDGYYRGKLCKQDVYVWKVSGKYVNGQSFVKKGDLTLLH